MRPKLRSGGFLRQPGSGRNSYRQLDYDQTLRFLLLKRAWKLPQETLAMGRGLTLTTFPLGGGHSHLWAARASGSSPGEGNALLLAFLEGAGRLPQAEVARVLLGARAGPGGPASLPALRQPSEHGSAPVMTHPQDRGPVCWAGRPWSQGVWGPQRAGWFSPRLGTSSRGCARWIGWASRAWLSSSVKFSFVI